MFTAKNITKSFEKRIVLRDVTISAEQSQVVGVICPDDETRKTLMDILGCVIEADQGTIDVDGMTIESETSTARNMIGYVPERPALYADMTLRASMKFQADARGMSPRSSQATIDDTIRLFGLEDVADKMASNLHESAARMFGIAQACFFNPRVLIVDEPTKLLDVKDALILREAIASLISERKMSVILASSNITELASLCTTVLVVEDGRITAEGPVSELKRMQRRTDAVSLLCGSDEAGLTSALKSLTDVSIEKTVKTDDGLEAILHMKGDRRAEIARAVVGANIELKTLAPVFVSLDQVIKNLSSDRVKPLEAVQQKDA
ncbi:MAG: ABC transporter ATP-binding protein [Clostridia bacterium]|nr:ABC transporter ATP-binding protein [Clostridia bacterium]